MAITIKLKSNLSEVLFPDSVEVGGISYEHTALICLAPDIEEKLGTSIKVVGYNYLPKGVDNPKFGTFIFASIEGRYPIHPDWVETLEGEELRSPINISESSDYIPLTASKAYNLATNELVSLSEVPVCTSCGAAIDTSSELRICDSCLVSNHFNVRNHSYRPDFKFYGEQRGRHAKANNVWYGIELEYGFNTREEMAVLSYKHPELYLKSDSSISGGNYRAELVTHPATFEYLTDPSSWTHKVNTLNVEDRPSKNGCHIHVSRTAFKDDKHYAKFKYLLQSNLELLQSIGGRSFTDFCRPYAPLKQLFRTGKASRGGERYRVINENNEHTFELRFMASTTKPNQLIRYIEFVDSMIKYTAYHYNTASLEQYFSMYLTKYKDKYPRIFKFLSSRTDKLVGSVNYRTPEKCTVSLLNASVSQLQAAVSIATPGNSEVSISEESRSLIDVDREGNIKRVFGLNVNDIPADKIIITYLK